MGRAYSLDLRERVVAAVAAGESCRSVAATFKVSVASVVKWSQRFRATGSAAARQMGGNRPYALSSERDWLLKRLADADIAFAEVNTMADLAVHPHLRRIEVETPNGVVAYPAPAAIVVGESRHYGPVPAIGDNKGTPSRTKSS